MKIFKVSFGSCNFSEYKISIALFIPHFWLSHKFSAQKWLTFWSCYKSRQSHFFPPIKQLTFSNCCPLPTPILSKGKFFFVPFFNFCERGLWKFCYSMPNWGKSVKILQLKWWIFLEKFGLIFQKGYCHSFPGNFSLCHWIEPLEIWQWISDFFSSAQAKD